MIEWQLWKTPSDTQHLHFRPFVGDAQHMSFRVEMPALGYAIAGGQRLACDRDRLGHESKFQQVQTFCVGRIDDLLGLIADRLHRGRTAQQMVFPLGTSSGK